MVRMHVSRHALAIALALATSALLAASARADDPAAQAAFEEARKLMEQARYAQACAKYEESQRIEAGIATQFRLAECYEKDGRVASAWKNYQAVATTARAVGQTERERFAQERADALALVVPYLTVEVPADVAGLDGLEVRVDGEVVPPAGWGRIPVDPGPHDVEARADRHEPWMHSVATRGEGKQVLVSVPSLVIDAARSGRAEPAVGREAQRSDEVDPKLIAGLVIGGVGLAAIGAGVGIGFAAKGKYDDTGPNCVEERCNQQGFDRRQDARKLGNAGTGVFIAGAALSAAGIVLALTSLASDDDGDVARVWGWRVALESGLDGAAVAAEVTW